MGIYDVLDDWAGLLEAAGVPVTTDSRAQFSSPAGYVLFMPTMRGNQRMAGRRDGWLTEGDVYCVADGPWGTAAARALDALLAATLAVLDEYVEYWENPDVLTLAAVGIDQPAVLVHYSNVPVSFAT